MLAQEEARTLKHNYIGTEHILLGLMREEEGLAARVLEHFDVRIEDVRSGVLQLVGSEDEETIGQIPFTPRAKIALEKALAEALAYGHNYIGTEHVLLGLVGQTECVGTRVLAGLDVTAEKVRGEVERMLSGPGARQTLQDYLVVPAGEIRRARATDEFTAAAQVAAREAMLGDQPGNRKWVVVRPNGPGRKIETKRSMDHEPIDHGEG